MKYRRNRIVSILFAAYVCFTLSGCIFVKSPVVPHLGTFFNDTSMPVDITFGNTTIGPKVGRSQSNTIMLLFAYGDSSVQAAAENGDIQIIDHVDAHITNILFGIYVQYETVVWGR